MALYAITRPTKRGLLNAIIVDAADSGAALTAAQAISAQVTDAWPAVALSSLIDADNPARVFGRYGLVLNGQRSPGK